MRAIADPVQAERPESTLGEDDGPTTITTTLYDLVATIRDAAGACDDSLVVATVVHLLRSHRVTLLGDLDPSTL